MDVKGYQFVGPRGNELKAKLEKIEPENDETSKRFLQAVDKNVNYKISNEEADKALAALKLFNVGNIKVLTKSEVDKIVSALNPSGKNISGLEALGTVYPAKINGKDYKAVMIEYSKVKELIDLKEIKKDFDEEHDVRNGYIVNFSFMEQRDLLVAVNKAIAEKNPKLKVGLFNHRAAENVYKVLNEAKVHENDGPTNFWTGEKFNGKDLDEKNYSEPGLVLEDKLKNLENSRFVSRRFNGTVAGTGVDPDDRVIKSAVVFGALKK